MSADPHAREQAILNLLTRDHYNMHNLGESPRLNYSLKRLAIVLGDQQPDYAWATVTSNAWSEEAGTLHVLAGDAVVSAAYGRVDSHAVKVEPLSVVDLDVELHTTEPSDRTPGGVYEVNVTLNRDNGRKPIKLKAQSLQDDNSVQALLGLVRTLTSRLG